MQNLPNFLTVIRIILIPVYLFYFISGNYFSAGIIFLVSVSTDFFDGFIARKYNLISKIGRLLDVFADKLTIISILLALVIRGIIPKSITIIILSREIFLLIGGIIVYNKDIDVIQPSKLGKISMFLLYLAISAALLNISYIDIVLFYIALPLNIISGLEYIIIAFKNTDIM
ncbi:MAG: CDP-diacylglycerol--glycerol-3-phosphate 3-phosphatidyltransferase [Bacillota bacterium]